MNISLVFLSISSLIGSPQFAYSNTKQHKSINFYHIYSNRFFNQFIFLSSEYFTCSFKQSEFKYFMNVPIQIRSLQTNSSISKEVLTSNTELLLVNSAISEHFTFNETVLNVSSCLFDHCISESVGGAVEFINQGAQLNVISTAFNSCSSTLQSGAIYLNGAYLIWDEYGRPTNSSSIQNCCFMNCSGNNYGVVGYICSKESEINNCYSVGCYNLPNTNGFTAFFTRSRRFSSEFLNITKSTMSVMSGLCMFETNPATIKFQTNIEHISNCVTYSCSTIGYSQYSYINYFNITLNNRVDRNWGGLIYSRFARIEIDYCCISTINLTHNQTIFTQFDGSLTVNHCYIDMDVIPSYGRIISQSVISTSSVLTFDFITSGFSSCDYHIASSAFSGSNSFTQQSSQFTKSSQFTHSSQFTQKSLSDIPDYMTHSYTQTLSVTYVQSISMSSLYESSNIFTSIELPDGQFTITQSQIYDYTQIPIYSYTIIPTEYSYEILIDTRPTQKKMSLVTILTIICGLLGGLLIILIIIFVVIWKSRQQQRSKQDFDKSETTSSNHSLISLNTDLLNNQYVSVY